MKPKLFVVGKAYKAIIIMSFLVQALKREIAIDLGSLQK